VSLTTRVGDVAVGSCSAHRRTLSVVVTWITGAPTVLTNGTPTVTSVGVGISSCGHVASVIGFSGSVRAEGAGIHRVGDSGSLPGGVVTTVSGSGNVITGG
jgi:hypothetical protein